MSELPLVIPGEIIASEHINDIMLRTLQRYASEAVRDVETPTPVAGELAYIEDIAEVQVFTDAAWGVWRVPSLRAAGAVLVEGSGQGYWWKPATIDNLQDWRLIDSSGGLVLQDRKSGTFGTSLEVRADGGILTQKPVGGFDGVFRNIHWGTTIPDVGLGADGDIYYLSATTSATIVVYLKSGGIWRGP